MRRTKLLLLLVALWGLLPSPAWAEEDESPPVRVLVGTKQAPPFAMKDAAGAWSGISIELWERIARAAGYETEYQETTLEGLLEGVRDGTFDAAAAAITVTSAREEEIDFTHAFYTSGLGIAVRAEGGSGWRAVLERIFSSEFLRAILALVGILMAVGLVIWLFERRRNAAQFGGKPAEGIGNAFWWSAVTMTTVGYGDKAPVTLGGRLVALVWMFASILLIAGFTGSIASALTVSRLEGAVQGPEDLPGLEVGTVPDSTSDRYLRERFITRRSYPSADEALRGLVRGEIDAVVYDAPLLEYRVGHDDRLTGRLQVLPRRFERQDYAFALPPGDVRREAVNRRLLEVVNSDDWQEVLRRYLGE